MLPTEQANQTSKAFLIERLPGFRANNLKKADSTAPVSSGEPTLMNASRTRAKCAREEWLKTHLKPADQGDDAQASFQPGMILESIGNAIMREAEDMQSKRIKLLPASSKVEVLSLSTTSARRMQVRDAEGVDGWVSICKESNEELWTPIPPITAGCKLYLGQEPCWTESCKSVAGFWDVV